MWQPCFDQEGCSKHAASSPLARSASGDRLIFVALNIIWNELIPCISCVLQLCFFTVHWGACGFYYIAKQSGFTDMTWVGANMDWVGRGSAFDKWTYSMYWSIITFSTVVSAVAVQATADQTRP